MSDIQTKTAEATLTESEERDRQVTGADSQPTADRSGQEEGGQSDGQPNEQPNDAKSAIGSGQAPGEADEGGQSGDQDRSSDGQPANESSADLNKVRIVTKALKNIERDIANVIRLLESGATLPTKETVQVLTSAGAVNRMSREETASFSNQNANGDGRVIEGVFDGQSMIGSDGKSYTVPANYASKSKLVEGDMLKLTITPRGSFIYKQIGPIERSRVMATLGFDPTIGEYYAADDSRRWNVLKASVTYYRGDPGDEVVLLIPKSAPSKWAAVENVIKGGGLDEGYGQGQPEGADRHANAAAVEAPVEPAAEEPDSAEAATEYQAPEGQSPEEGQPMGESEQDQSDKGW